MQDKHDLGLAALVEAVRAAEIDYDTCHKVRIKTCGDRLRKWESRLDLLLALIHMGEK